MGSLATPALVLTSHLPPTSYTLGQVVLISCSSGISCMEALTPLSLIPGHISPWGPRGDGWQQHCYKTWACS